MARPLSKGLDYFPLDIDIDQDDKVALVEADHGIVGFGIVIKLFMKIYGNGYYYDWGEKEQKLFVRRVNVDIETLSLVVNDSIRWGIFDKEIYNKYGILTSKGIQKRFFEACSRRKDVEVVKPFLLLSRTELQNFKNLTLVDGDEVLAGVNVDNNPPSTESMSALTPQSKVKERRVKESKEEDGSNPSSHPAIPPEFEIQTNKNGVLFPISSDDIKDWEELYPAVDVRQEIRKMIGWSDANPSKRKTSAGMKRFITAWLGREQDRGGTKGYVPAKKSQSAYSAPEPSLDDYKLDPNEDVAAIIFGMLEEDKKRDELSRNNLQSN